ncbi:MAG: hypothetical protein K2X49_16670 [Acetobacteraceae bacterium]|nr:hypothetical protein [Acetobacteraceae bacterium]
MTIRPQQPRELSADRTKRGSAPGHVWDYQAVRNWRATLWELGGDMLSEPVKEAFLAEPPEWVVGDDLSWLDRAVKRGIGRHLDTKAEVADRLRDTFTHLRACHATSTADVSAFYAQGLLPLDVDAANDQARRIFLGGEFPELGEEDLERAIAAVGRDVREGRVWFEANEKSLVEDCGHYLLYGGEYLTGVVASLPRHRDYRQVLKGRGRPTMLICDVPLADIHPATFLEFVGGALEILFQDLLDWRESQFIPEDRGAGFCIRKPLAPEQIIGHYHPVRVRDPLIGGW